MPRLMLIRNPYGDRKARLGVQIKATAHDLRQGMNVARQGRYLFRGAWYGHDLTKSQAYGKIEGVRGMPIGKLVGRPSPYILRKMGASPVRIGVAMAKHDRQVRVAMAKRNRPVPVSVW